VTDGEAAAAGFGGAGFATAATGGLGGAGADGFATAAGGRAAAGGAGGLAAGAAPAAGFADGAAGAAGLAAGSGLGGGGGGGGVNASGGTEALPFIPSWGCFGAPDTIPSTVRNAHDAAKTPRIAPMGRPNAAPTMMRMSSTGSLSISVTTPGSSGEYR
jgi:hypothetical protein